MAEEEEEKEKKTKDTKENEKKKNIDQKKKIRFCISRRRSVVKGEEVYDGLFFKKGVKHVERKIKKKRKNKK